ncbi:TadE family protein [Segeticoccus rhizosphaerae]|uniref:TadE family protein n=1 Tax=Segeticoccus rhizosphaerae TaxID=1104777 RepID=UPI001264D50E|nr:TadE family protein [Segeticoccus rhizosphaerae]
MTREPDRGSAAIEAAIGVPAFMMFVLLIVFGGRVTMARQAVASAAADAARSASISRTQPDANSAATGAASTSLANQSVGCTSTHVSVDTTGFAAVVGTPASVRATVTCTVDLSNLSAPGIPGSMTITESMTSPLDTYRER